MNSHSRELLSGAQKSFAMKVLGACLSYGMSVVLSNILGADGSGVFFFGLTLIIVLSTVGRAGMDNTLIKYIALSATSRNYSKILGVYKKSVLSSLVFSLILAVALYVLSPWISRVVFDDPELLKTLQIMAMSIVPLSLLTLHAAALQGFKKVVKSISILNIFVPGFTIFFTLFFLINDVYLVSIGYLISTFIALFFGVLFWKNTIKDFQHITPKFDTKQLLETSIPLFNISILQILIVWLPLLLLGFFGSNEDVGFYNAAARTAMLTSFVLMAVNSIATPKFSEVYHNGDIKELGRLARQATKIATLCALPLFLFSLFFSEWIMSFFGEEFKEASLAFMILAIGQFINAATGSVGYLLMMTGHEKRMRNNLFISLLISALLNLMLIPEIGLVGAAISTTIAQSLHNLIAMSIVKKELNISTISWLTMKKK